jgi:hypothetical protein
MLGAVVLGALDGTSAQQTMTVSVSESAVDLLNVPSGGTVVLMSCARGSRQRHASVGSNAIVLHDDDRDGRIRHTPKDPIPLRSVWVAVDYASGATATGARHGFEMMVRPLSEEALRKDAENELAFLEQDVPALIVFLVRPGTSVWQLVLRDGSTADRDKTPNGRLKLAFEDAHTIEGRDKAPKHLKKDDVIVAFDPGYLDVWFTQIVSK